MIRSEHFEAFGAEIEKMHFACGRDVPNPLIVEAYWETLSDLSWDEFKAGMFNARQNNEGGFLPADGVIRGEALQARDFLAKRRKRDAQRLQPAEEPAREWPQPSWLERPAPTVAELVESYGKAADLAEANLRQTRREYSMCMPGDPGLGDIIERQKKHRSNRDHYRKLARQYAEMLEHGETESTQESEERALDRRAKRAREGIVP